MNQKFTDLRGNFWVSFFAKGITRFPPINSDRARPGRNVTLRHRIVIVFMLSLLAIVEQSRACEPTIVENKTIPGGCYPEQIDGKTWYCFDVDFSCTFRGETYQCWNHNQVPPYIPVPCPKDERRYREQICQPTFRDCLRLQGGSPSQYLSENNCNMKMCDEGPSKPHAEIPY